MKKALTKKLEILGLEIPVIALLLVGIGAGALLSYYGAISGTATVDQSVVLDGNPCDPDMAACTVTGA